MPFTNPHTHFNLLDTMIALSSKEVIGNLYAGWDGMNAEQFSEKFSMPLNVASVLVDYSEWADKNDWKPWNM